MAKVKTLFDHIKEISQVQRPDYWDTLTESDRKTWSTYMVHRFLSMNPDWLVVVNYAQTLDVSPKVMYQFYTSVLPKSRSFLKYIKSKKQINYNKKLVELLSKYYELGHDDIYTYLTILEADEIEEIIKLHGMDTKEAKLLMRGL
jgi:hypothetical protein